MHFCLPYVWITYIYMFIPYMNLITGQFNNVVQLRLIFAHSIQLRCTQVNTFSLKNNRKKICLFFWLSFFFFPQMIFLWIAGLKCQVFYRWPFRKLIASEKPVFQMARNIKAFIYGPRHLHMKYLAQPLSLTCSYAVMTSCYALDCKCIAIDGALVLIFLGPG